MLYDILAAQRLYGPDYSTRSGNTVYGFNANAGPASFDFAQRSHSVFAIWDGGGHDILDASGFAERVSLSLHPGTFSSTPGLTGNVAIAFGVAIEEARRVRRRHDRRQRPRRRPEPAARQRRQRPPARAGRVGRRPRRNGERRPRQRNGNGRARRRHGIAIGRSADLLARLSARDGGAFLDLGAGNGVFLAGVAPGSIFADSFVVFGRKEAALTQ